MQLRIRKQHINKYVHKGSHTFKLDENLTQKQLLFIKNMISSDFIESIPEVKKTVKKNANDNKNKEESSK